MSLSNLRFSKEPVAWLTAIGFLTEALSAYLTKTVDLATFITLVVTALSGVVLRQTVTAPANVKKPVPVNPYDGAGPHLSDPNSDDLWNELNEYE